MNPKSYLIILFFCALFSCENEPVSSDVQRQTATQEDLQSDTLVLSEQLIEKEFCISKGTDTLCATGSASILRVKSGVNRKATEKIRQQLQAQIGSDTISVTEYLENFVAGIAFYEEEDMEYWPAYYTLEVIQDVILSNEFLLTGTTAQYAEEGGAHGNYFSQGFNFDIKTGENLSWQDLFQDTLKVYEVAQKVLSDDLKENENTTESIFEFYDFIDKKFYLPNNFSISSTGLTFVYSVYEIASYADGEIEISLYFDEHKDLFKPNTVLTDYVSTLAL